MRVLREAAKLSRVKFAQVLDVDPSTIYRWETEQSPIPDEKKEMAAEYFGVTVAHLMGWNEAAVHA